MQSPPWLKLIFIGLAITLVAWMLEQTFHWYVDRTLGIDLFNDGWAITAGLLLALFGVYRLVASRLSR